MDLKKIIAHGVQAPSGHNTQPWKFKLNESSIEIYPNFSKELPVVDKNHRELFISLGCAAENICIAASASGYNAGMKILKQDELYIRIEFSKAEISQDQLFSQIYKRQTNRSVYKNKEIPKDEIEKLEMVDVKKPVTIYIYRNGEHSFDKLSEFIYEGNDILFSCKAFKDELLHWMRFNLKDLQKHRDGLAYNVFGIPSLPEFLGKPIVKSFLKPKSQNKSEKEKIGSSSHLVLITIEKNNPEQWIMAGRALERFWLKCTELGISLAFSNQPCEVQSLAGKIKTDMDICNSYPMLLMRIGYADPVSSSIRRSTEEVIIE